MLDEVMKGLGPLPILQFMLGLIAFAAASYALYKGLSSSKKEGGLMIEDKRAEWEAYRQLEQIAHNSEKMVNLMAKIVDGQLLLRDSFNALASALWNRMDRRD